MMNQETKEVKVKLPFVANFLMWIVAIPIIAIGLFFLFFMVVALICSIGGR